MAKSSIDELVAILDPLLHELVRSGLPDACDFLDLIVRVPSWTWCGELSIAKEDDVCLEVLRVRSLEHRLPWLSNFIYFLNSMLRLPEMLEELNHIGHCKFSALCRVDI